MKFGLQPMDEAHHPLVPQGAPARTMWTHFPGMFLLPLLGIWAISYLIDVTVGRSLALMGGGILFVSLFWYMASLIRYYDRVGWYEYKPIVPVIPLVISKWSSYSFQEHFIQVSRKERILYSQIERVIVNCKGVQFSGLEIHYASGKFILAGFEDCSNQPMFERRPIWVGIASGTGEPARNALAILRQKAPHAQFEGPEWIEQGWVPRLGFRNPNARGG